MKYSLLLFVSFLLWNCQSNNSAQTKTGSDGVISIENFKTKLASTDSPQLVDVRTPDEYNQGTLEGAINMNFNSSDLEKQLHTLDKTKPVFIFCQAGGRSGKCYQKMKNMGFEEVYDMQGGYGAWNK